MAGGPGLAVRVEEIGARLRRKAAGVDLGELLGKAGRDGEPVSGEIDCRLEQLGPWELAEFVVGELERGEYAGSAYRQPAGHGDVRGERLSVGVEKEVGRSRRGRSLAPVEACELVLLLVPIEDEGAAADARGLRLDQIEHHLCGDCRVDRAAALAQHGEACFGGERLGCDHHMPLRLDQRLRGEAAGDLRLFEGVQRRRPERDEKRERDEG